MLKLKFDDKLDFQIDAINSVVQLFEGQSKKSFRGLGRIVSNVLDIPPDVILRNLQEVQQRNVLSLSTIDDLQEPYNFTVEMETGTGKTYVYLRTILELNLKYGWTKFIIVVPSVAIKEGVLKNLDITKEHFKRLYENLPYSYFAYRSDNLARIRMFGQDTNLQIMVITKDAFNKDSNIMHNDNDRLGNKPIEIIQRTRPIVILDEPQKMGGKATQWGIEQLNPLVVLRYSATHREIYNLVYRLTPYDAYNFQLVKKIEILSVTEDNDPSSRKIILEQIVSTQNTLKALVKVFVKSDGGEKFKRITLKHGDDLARKTNNSYYSGFILNEINKNSGYICFSNGVKIFEGQSSINDDEVMRLMIHETIREHLDKKKRLSSRNIKVLSLFFLKRVDDYLPEDGIVRKMFEEEFNKVVSTEFTEFAGIDVKKVHSGYFSRMKTDKSIEEDESAYELIMKNRERLLSLEEPVEFIFSHSALREGWDNPNIFNICTLAYSSSEIKKRQEVGRGLRLPVDQYGNRIRDKEVNILTVITNESYREYLETLQSEYWEEVGEEGIPPVENKRERVKVKIRSEVVQGEVFKNLWSKVSRKSKYIVSIDKDKFVRQCIEEIDQIEVKPFEARIKRISVNEITAQGIVGEFTGEWSKEIGVDRVFNLVSLIERETNLTRNTILKILNGISNINKFFINPHEYAQKCVQAIKRCKMSAEIEGIRYVELDENYGSSILKDELTTYAKYLVKVEKSIYEEVIEDSEVERKFAEELDKDSRIKLFMKFPETYVVETPAGNYTPDWAVVVEKSYDGGNEKRIYFIVETKGTNEIHELRPEEMIKIRSAQKRFENEVGLRFVGPVKDFVSFESKW